MQSDETPYSQRDTLRNAVYVGLAALALLSLFAGYMLSLSDWDPVSFALVGTRFSEGDPSGTTGYDGQFFYFIARDGLNAVPLIDGPSLRYMRILYPFLARVVGLGQPLLVPWALIAINLLAYSTGTGLLACLLIRWGRSGWWALVYSVWIGGLFVLRLDLSELLCVALSLAAVAAYEHERLALSVILLVLACLTKELGLVFAGGLAFYHAVERRRWLQAGLIVSIPLTAFMTWLGVMWLWLGEWPTRYPAAHLHIPLYGWFVIPDPTVKVMTGGWLMAPALLLVVDAMVRVVRSRSVSLGTALLLAGGGFVLVMPDLAWEDPIAAFRVGMPLVVGGIAYLAHHRPRLLPAAAALWCPGALVAIMVSVVL